MPVKRKTSSKGLDEIRRLQTINDVLNRGSLENLLSYGSAKDSEAASENAADNLINQIASDKSNNRNITIIENLTKEGSGGENITKRKSITFASRGSKERLSRNIHMVKHTRPSSKRTKKAAGSKFVGRHKR